MDRAEVILANALLVIGIAGLVLLAIQYLGPAPGSATPAVVSLHPSVPGDHRTLAARTDAAPEPAGEIASRDDAASFDEPPNDEEALPPDEPVIAGADLLAAEENLAAVNGLATGQPVATADDRAVASVTPITSAPPLGNAVAWTIAPPRPARPQLAPDPAVESATEESLVAIGPAGSAAPSEARAELRLDEAQNSIGADSDWSDELSVLGQVGDDNLQAAHAPYEIMATAPAGGELSHRDRARMWDGLRWRDVFTDHLGPER